MQSFNFIPYSRTVSKAGRLAPPSRLRLMFHSASHLMRKPVLSEEFRATFTRRQDDVLAKEGAGVQHLASITRVQRPGPVPTIVLGGFVPDSTESVYLIRDLIQRHGSLYCVNYPRHGFSVDLLLAQLDDLVDEITTLHQRQPVVFAISFGVGLVLEWLRRRRLLGGSHDIKGLVLVSPVTCVEDLLDPGKSKASTLLGRAIQPYLNSQERIDPKLIERSRSIFTKMFEAGAQNVKALKTLMSKGEVGRLRERVMDTIKSIDFNGACERLRALRSFHSPSSYFSPGLLPLSHVPTLILYAEKEESVVTDSSPARFVFENAHRAYFPRSHYAVVRNPGGSPVQHASLIFHHVNFRPSLNSFYKTLHGGWLRRAA